MNKNNIGTYIYSIYESKMYVNNSTKVEIEKWKSTVVLMVHI